MGIAVLCMLAVIDLNPTKMLVKAQVKNRSKPPTFQNDDDDLQVAIDNKMLKTSSLKHIRIGFGAAAHKHIKILPMRVLVQNISPGSFVTIDFYADRTPKIEELRVFFKDTNSRPIFDKLLVIDDSELVNLVLSRDQIDDFLRDKANGQPEHIAFQTFEAKPTAEIIYQACNAHSINPKVILAKLQAEQGLVEGSGAAILQKSSLTGPWGSEYLTMVQWIKDIKDSRNKLLALGKHSENFNKAEGKNLR